MCCCALYQPQQTNCVITPTQNHFLEPNRRNWSFLHPILLCRIAYWAPLEMLLD
jgi:hypothetical protein